MTILLAALMALPSSDPIMDADKVYEQCLTRQVKAYAKATEEVSPVLDAAFSDCREQRSALLKVWLGDKPVSWQGRQNVEESLDLMDKDRRKRLTAVLLKSRLAAR